MGSRRTHRRLIVLAALYVAFSARGDDGLRIEEFVQTVIRAHPTTGAAQALDATAAAQSRAARLLPDPALELTLGRGRPSDGSGPSKTETGLAVSQVIPWFPARSATIDAADREADVLRADATAARWALELDARLAFYRLLQARVLLDIARTTDADARSLLDLVTRRASLGETREVDRIKARVEWLKQEREMRVAEREATAAEGALRTLAVSPLPTPLHLSGELPRPSDGASALRDAAPDRLDQSPALLRARAEAARASAVLASTRRSRVPDLGLSLFGQRELDREAWGASLGVILPLWNARRGDIARADAEARLTSAEASNARLSLLIELETRRRDVETAASQVTTLSTELLPSAAESVRLARLLFEEGETSLLDLLDAQRTVRDAQREETRARYELASALASLSRLLGPQTPSGR
ncbi:MAG TPA: TolC family protein [Thermoanaerobaculia bacterium]|nr:TolC family protein [Thermoanaerobaculia bacterium]